MEKTCWIANNTVHMTMTLFVFGSTEKWSVICCALIVLMFSFFLACPCPWQPTKIEMLGTSAWQNDQISSLLFIDSNQPWQFEQEQWKKIAFALLCINSTWSHFLDEALCSQMPTMQEKWTKSKIESQGTLTNAAKNKVVAGQIVHNESFQH